MVQSVSRVEEESDLKTEKLTAIIRKSEKEYVSICLEVNVAARGKTIPEVESNLMVAVNEFLDYVQETGLEVEPIPIQELIEFLVETSPSKSIPCSDVSKPAYTFHQLIDRSQYA